MIGARTTRERTGRWTLVAAMVVVSALVPLRSAASAATVARPVRFYLAVGASESLGVQPVGPRWGSAPTDHGYANDVLAVERGHWPGLALEQMGCPGITVQAALYGGGTCGYPSGSEVRTAVSFLRHHRPDTVLVTVDLGFNDVWPCLADHRVHVRCEASALRQIRHALPQVVLDLRRAGGPHMDMVGLEHNDPYLGSWRAGHHRFAAASERVVATMNALLARIYRHGGAVVADVPAQYAASRRSDATVAADDDGHRHADADAAMTGSASTAEAASRMCALTWYCSKHNIHPDAAGYRAIALAITEALGSKGAVSPVVATHDSGPGGHHRGKRVVDKD